MIFISLVNKAPADTEPEHKALCGIMKGRKIIVGKPKPIGKTNGIQVFGPDEHRERFNAEMKESSYIRQVLNRNRILRAELANKGRIIIRFKRSMIPDLQARTQVKILIK